MEIHTFDGENFKVAMESEGWKIGFLRYGDRFMKNDRSERHLETDEAFVLLEGKAVLIEEKTEYEMEKCKVYNVKKGMWHHIIVTPGTTVLVIENSDTSAYNTERRFFQ